MKGNFFVWEKILPALATIVAIALVTGAMLWIRSPKEKTSPSLAAELPKKQNVGDATEDADGDGIPNWEEMLLKTDPHNPDTNGNGVSDGEEKKMADAADMLPETHETSTTTKNLTKQLGRDLYWSYSVVKGFDEYDTNAKKKITRAMVEAIEQATAPELLDVSKLRTTADTSKERVLRYGEEVFTAFKPFFDVQYDIIDIAYFTDGNLDSKANLEKQVLLYQTLANTLLTMEVPEDARDMHIAMAQAFSLYGSALKKIVLLREDPLQTAIGMREYDLASANTLASVKKFTAYLEAHGTNNI